MRFYSAKVRLAGNPYHEVLKTDLSAPEIIVLRHVHGEDAVLDIRQTGERQVDHIEERKRLEREYTSFTDDDGNTRSIVPTLFGALYSPLPLVAPGVNDGLTVDPSPEVKRVDAKALEALTQ